MLDVREAKQFLVKLHS